MHPSCKILQDENFSCKFLARKNFLTYKIYLEVWAPGAVRTQLILLPYLKGGAAGVKCALK